MSAKAVASKAPGFTLIEVLVVMIIISIVGSAAVLTITHNQRTRLKDASVALTQALQFAETQAMLQPAIIGWAELPSGYGFYVYQEADLKQNAHWERIETTQLRPPTLPSNIVFHLQGLSGKETETPRLIFSTSGDVTPFTIAVGFRDEAPQFLVEGKSNGTIDYVSAK